MGVTNYLLIGMILQVVELKGRALGFLASKWFQQFGSARVKQLLLHGCLC